MLSKNQIMAALFMTAAVFAGCAKETPTPAPCPCTADGGVCNCPADPACTDPNCPAVNPTCPKVK